MGHQKARSRLQQAQAAYNLAIINKENALHHQPPPEKYVLASFLHAAVQSTHAEHLRGNDYKCRYNNEHRKKLRSKLRIETLQTSLGVEHENSDILEELQDIQQKNIELVQNKDAIRKRKERAPAQTAFAVKKSILRATTHQLQEKGVISDSTREMIRELVSNGISVANIDNVIHIVSEGVGVEVSDHISTRSVGRIVLEV
jgi:hypothetical protein